MINFDFYKQLESLAKSKPLPPPRDNLTINKIVTPPRPTLTIPKLLSPLKDIEYPPSESDQDILEIDLQISESESDSEAKAKKATANNQNHKPAPIKPFFHEPKRPTELTPWQLQTIKKSIATQNRRKLHAIHHKPRPFQLPQLQPLPAKRPPSPTFARFNPGLAYPSVVPSPPTIIINNYYGQDTIKPQPICLDPKLMSRGQFKRFAKRKTTTQAQIDEALAIRRQFKH